VALLRPVFPPEPGVTQTLTRQGIGARIYLRVPGVLKPALAISRVSSSEPYGALGGGRGSVTAIVADTGNTMLDTTVQMRITDAFDRTVYTFPKTIVAAFLPGNTATIKKPWPHLPHLGRYTIHVSATGTGASASGAKVVWILPWLLLLLIAIVIVAMVTSGRWWSRRRKARRAPVAPQPDPATVAGRRRGTPEPVARRPSAT
jgi:hypothetical protein